MRLENILALTHATLINEPYVNNFETIVFEVSKIKRGDLFVAFNTNEIQQAIENGAYGVMFEKPTQMSDTEIAWIKVDNLERALVKLLRFRLIEKDLRVYECNEIILKLALQVISESSFIPVFGNIQTLFKSLWHVEEKATLLFCPTLVSADIFTNVKTLPKTRLSNITIMEQTLFETSFIFENTFYERQLISPFFIPFLEELLNLYKILKIGYRLKKFTPIEHFEAVFTNKNFEIKEFGTSDKVLIFEPNTTLIESEINFLQKQASWAKTIYLIPHAMNKNDRDDIYTYEDKDEIIPLLQSKQFHFALIVGVDKSILQQPNRVQKQLTLEF